jgi:hypothetical protein
LQSTVEAPPARAYLLGGMGDLLDDVPLLSDLRYEDLEPGQRWGPFLDELAQATSDALRAEVGDVVPGTAAPLGVLPLLTLRALRWATNGIIPGGILTRQHFAAIGALPAAGPVEVDVWISDQQHRPSGFYTTFAFTLRAGDGRTPAVVEWTILAPRDAER